MSDPLKPVRQLLERLREITDPMGLRIIGTVLVPGDNQGISPDHLQVVFEIEADNLTTTGVKVFEADEMLKFRKELDDFNAETKQANLKESLQKMMEQGGGFLPPAEYD